MLKEIRINATTGLRIFEDNSVKLIVYRRCPKSAIWGENESDLHLEDAVKLVDTLWLQADKMGWKPYRDKYNIELRETTQNE